MLKDKIITTFEEYLNSLSYGITNKKYDTLFDAVVFLNSEISNENYEKFLILNL